jgi:hypothetical protein
MTDDIKGPPPLLNAPSYSNAVLHLCQRIKDAKTPGERAELMLQLANRFYKEHDPTDAKLNDDYHEFFEDYEQARMNFQQAALRLARLAMSEVDEAFETSDVSLDDVRHVGKTVN